MTKHNDRPPCLSGLATISEHSQGVRYGNSIAGCAGQRNLRESSSVAATGQSKFDEESTGTGGSLTRDSDETDLPYYPIPAGERLETHSYFKLHHQNLMESDFFLACKDCRDWEAFGLAVSIWCKVQLQDPVGTLPIDPKRQAWILGMPIVTWEGYLRRDPSPLYGWTPCRIIGSGEIRLMHKTVTAVALDALKWKRKDQDRKVADQERQALNRLRKTMKDIAPSVHQTPRDIFNLHRALSERYPDGNRTVSRIIEVVDELMYVNSQK